MNYKNYTQHEVEFFAENQLIQIIPNFREDKFYFISGEFGPFRPAKPATVPLWLAIYLKQRNKCQVQLPKWLDYEFLTKVKSVEKELALEFSDELPFYYYEIANLLLLNCADEFSSMNSGSQAMGAQKVRSVIEDIFELRKEKMLRIFKTFQPETPVKFLSNCGSVEINQVRNTIAPAYGVVDLMQAKIENAANEALNQTQAV